MDPNTSNDDSKQTSLLLYLLPVQMIFHGAQNRPKLVTVVLFIASKQMLT
jgi:hypothetical protein